MRTAAASITNLLCVLQQQPAAIVLAAAGVAS